MLQILTIVIPVFMVIAAGYLAVRLQFYSDAMIDGLMKFAILFAVPCLLFRATAYMDIGSAYDGRLMLAFYSGALLSFSVGVILARKCFKRPRGEAVAVGFSALFSNLVLLGLPISQRAWGADNIAPAFAIVSVHAPFCYLVGITVMELLRRDGRSLPDTAMVVAKAMFRNSIMIGLGLGFLVNFSGLLIPKVIDDGIELMAQTALPAALFALGGVLTRYRFKQAMGEMSMVTVLSLFLHPLLVFIVCSLLGVSAELSRIAVLLAAMPPGLNSYLFAVMYQRGQGTAASTVLLATLLAVFSVTVWLWILQ